MTFVSFEIFRSGLHLVDWLQVLYPPLIQICFDCDKLVFEFDRNVI